MGLDITAYSKLKHVGKHEKDPDRNEGEPGGVDDWCHYENHGPGTRRSDRGGRAGVVHRPRPRAAGRRHGLPDVPAACGRFEGSK